jgi:diguanylate cyclase (GGDEF)-like protein/PAS domain S-box-containing protein
MRVTYGLPGLKKRLVGVSAHWPARELLLGVAYLLTACASLALTRVTEGVALFWPANALAAAVLIRLPQVRWFSAVCILLSAGIAANVVAGQGSWELATLFSCTNLFEIAVMVAVFRFAIRFPYPEITIAHAGIMTVLFGILIPGLAAILGGWVMQRAFGTAWWPSGLEWGSSDALGACLLGPPIILFSSKAVRRLASRARLAQNVLMGAICLLACYLAMRYARFPFAAIGLPLLIAAFQLGGFGISVLSLFVGMFVIALWALGIRPLGPQSSAHITSLTGLPIIALLATVMPPVAVGLGTDARRKMGRALRASERRFRESMDRSPIDLTAQIESLEARRRAEEKLAEERELLKATLLAIDDALITTDTHGRITYLNRAAESLLGLELRAVATRRLDEIIYLTDPQSCKVAANLIAQSVMHGQVSRRHGGCLLHRPDGTVRHITDVVSPVLDSQGLVTGTVVVLRDASAEFEQARELNHRARHDALTGLPNRMEFQQRVHKVFQRARHVEVPAAMLAIDLDHFKAVNDAAGHAAGDAVLRQVAEVFRLNVRTSDTVARLGGDEFAVILESCSPERAGAIARQLLRALNPLTLTWKGAVYQVGASIGLACTNCSMGSEQDWLAAADDACYQGKREGRGRLKIADVAAVQEPEPNPVVI